LFEPPARSRKQRVIAGANSASIAVTPPLPAINPAFEMHRPPFACAYEKTPGATSTVSVTHSRMKKRVPPPHPKT
jgi:hypothetical protein